MAASSVPLATLNTDYQIPLLGMGCSRNIENLNDSVLHALQTGYRLFDSARIYRNEKELGQYLKDHIETLNIPRSEVFITTKIPIINENTEENVDKHIADALNNFQVDYLDLVLVHYPRDRDTGVDEDREVNARGRKIVWQKLEDYNKRGIIRSIGVSNYEVYHLNELLSYAKVIPAVNQIEYHPYCTKPQVTQVCRQNNILVQAYSSLMWGNQDILKENIIVELSKKYNITPQQALFAFAINTGVGVIPKSQTQSRIVDNFNSHGIKFTDSEVKELLLLDKNQQFCPNCYPWRTL